MAAILACMIAGAAAYSKGQEPETPSPSQPGLPDHPKRANSELFQLLDEFHILGLGIVAIVGATVWIKVGDIRKKAEGEIQAVKNKAEETEEKLRREITTKIEHAFQEAARKRSDALHADFSRLVDLLQVQHRLFTELDLDEPCIRHPMSVAVRYRAQSYLQKLQRLNSEFADDTLTSFDHERHGDVCHYLYEYDNALESYKRALTLEEACDHADAAQIYNIKRKIGNSHAGKKEYTLAVEKYHEVESKGRHDARLLLSYGDALQGLGRYHDAIDKYNAAIELTQGLQDPRQQSICMEAHYQKGNALATVGDCQQAIEEYNAILKRAPFEMANFGIADAYRKLGNWKDSLRHFEEERKINARKGETYFRMGQVHAACGNFKEACRYYNLANEAQWHGDGHRDPAFAASRGYALIQCANDREADSNRARIDYYEGKRLLREAVGSAKEEVDNVQKLPGRDRGTAEAQAKYGLAVCYAMRGENGDTEEALESLKGAIEANEYCWKWAVCSDHSDFKILYDDPRFKQLKPLYM